MNTQMIADREKENNQNEGRNKMTTEKIAKLINEVENYNRATKGLVSKLNEVDDFITKLTEDFSEKELKMLDKNQIGIRLLGSRLGCHRYLVYLDREGDFEIAKVIGRSGREFCWHNQYGYWGQYMNKEELLHVAKNISKWIENANDIIEKEREKVEELMIMTKEVKK